MPQRHNLCRMTARTIGDHAVHFMPYPPILLTGWDVDKPISRVAMIGKGLGEMVVQNY